MNWGTKIIIAFVAFAVLIISMVVISMRQNINLVAKDYYKQEIAYQQQIERLKNASSSSGRLTVKHDHKAHMIILCLQGQKSVSGEVHFFRPSDAGMDKKYLLKPDTAGNQYFPVLDFEEGLWKVKVSWNDGSKAFYKEKLLVL